MPIHDSGPCILRGDMDPYWKKFLEPKSVLLSPRHFVRIKTAVKCWTIHEAVNFSVELLVAY
jgi:hypothetical protein